MASVPHALESTEIAATRDTRRETGVAKELRAKVAEPARLWRAWYSVRRRSNWASHGVDQQTVKEFDGTAKQQIKIIRSQLRDRTFKPQQYVGVAISKGRGQHRPISVATVRDRVVQRAVLDAIWVHIRDAVCHRFSFGGVREYRTHGHRRTETRRARNVRAAAQHILSMRDSGKTYVFETDIVNFFPSINRELLLGRLQSLLPDDSLDELILAFVSTDVANASHLGRLADLWDPELGVPQGGVLSPVFANLYLSEFDQVIDGHGLCMTRYIDDLVIQTETQEDGRRAHDIVECELKQLKLDIHPLGTPDSKGRIKTRVLGPRDELEFLGLRFTSKSIRPSEEAFEKVLTKIDQTTDVNDGANSTLVEVVRNVRAVVDGWLASYQICNLSAHDLNAIDHRIRQRVGGWMMRNDLIHSPKVLDVKKQACLGLTVAARSNFTPLMKANER
jgi:RNA-directed DNA polymerase